MAALAPKSTGCAGGEEVLEFSEGLASFPWTQLEGAALVEHMRMHGWKVALLEICSYLGIARQQCFSYVMQFHYV